MLPSLIISVLEEPQVLSLAFIEWVISIHCGPKESPDDGHTSFSLRRVPIDPKTLRIREFSRIGDDNVSECLRYKHAETIEMGQSPGSSKLGESVEMHMPSAVHLH